MNLEDDHLRILKALANLGEREGLSTKGLSDALLLTHGYVRELAESLEELQYVESNGPGLADAICITWSGRVALQGALSGGSAITVHGGFVQIGDYNVQNIDEADEEEDE